MKNIDAVAYRIATIDPRDPGHQQAARRQLDAIRTLILHSTTAEKR